MTEQFRETSTETPDLDRRALLRRGGAAVVAGVAGVAAVQALTQTGAQAVAGPMSYGAANDAGTDLTSLTSSNATATLQLANTGAGAPLNLVASGVTDAANLANGDLANLDGDLVYATSAVIDGVATTIPGAVYTEYNASQTVQITPLRALDTRTTAGRANIVDAAGKLDGAGRLLGGQTIELSLADYVTFGLGAFLNVTAVGALQAGYLTVYPGGTRPGTSTVNYGVNQVVSNGAVVGLSADDSVFIYALRTTHVVVDVTAFTVASYFDVDPGALGGLKAARAAKVAKSARARAARAAR